MKIANTNASAGKQPGEPVWRRFRPFDESGIFRAGLHPHEITRRAIRGAGVTVLSGGLGLVLQMIATILLVRLLRPADFGVTTMVSAFSLLLVNLGLNGFTEAIVQRETLNEAQVTNIFWISVGVGSVVTIAFAAAGSLLAAFYGDPRVTRVAAAMSATILITCASVQHLALLKRAMRFPAISTVEVIARAVTVAVSIVLAWEGFGYWALVAGAIATPLVTTIGAWYFCDWRPGLPRRVAGTGAMVLFAIHTYGRFTLNYIGRNGDNFLVGWRFGAISLGFYKKAYDLFALSTNQLVSPLTEVALSALSRMDPRSSEYRERFAGALSTLAFIGMGLSGVLTLTGNDVIRLLLGPAWAPAGRIFAFFGPGICAMLLYHTHGWIHLSIGRADRWLRWGLVEVVVTLLLFVVALPFGPEAIAMAWTASFWVLLLPAFWYAGQPIEFKPSGMFAGCWKFAFAAFAAGFGTNGIAGQIPFLFEMQGSRGAAARIAAELPLFVFVYLMAIVILHRGFGPLLRFGALLRQMLPAGVLSETSSEAAVSEEPVTEGSRSSQFIAAPMVSSLIPGCDAAAWPVGAIQSASSQTWPREEIPTVRKKGLSLAPDACC